MLAHELSDRNVDALLFQRMHAAGDAQDRWVAVLNLTATQARAYWSRPHELIHRLAEPPQRRLPFYRHRTDSQNRLERIIDFGAADPGRSIWEARTRSHRPRPHLGVGECAPVRVCAHVKSTFRG
jgi:hypothetical protein